MDAGTGSPSAGRSVYRFEGFTFDLVRGALFDARGTELRLRPKAYALLRYLIANAGRLVNRDEILAAVWPDVHVTEDSITLCVRELRRALDDEAQRLLRTVPRRGYLFAAEVTRMDAVLPLAPTALAGLVPPPAHDTATPAPELRASGRPMVVVLPFANMTGDAEQDYFADGITEDLTTALSHLRWFSVISRNSAFTYKGRAVDVRQVGAELGVGYVLEGSVRKAAGRVRISAQLCEVETGRHVWAERFDGELADIFDLQDRVTEAVVGAIEPSLRLAEVERARSRPTGSLTAYDLYLRALPHRYTTREGNAESLGLLRRAIALDPGFAAAKGALAGLHTVRFTQGWAEAGDVEEAVDCARQVAEAGGEDDPSALAAAAHALAYLARDCEAGLAAADRALRLAPNSPQVLLVNGWLRAYVGDAEAAIALLDRARRLSPVDPAMFFFSTAAGLAHFVAGRYAAAAEAARRAIHDRPAYVPAHRLLATSLAQLGELRAAAEATRVLLASVAPGYTVAATAEHSALRDPDLRERYLEGLRKAGLPA